MRVGSGNRRRRRIAHEIVYAPRVECLESRLPPGSLFGFGATVDFANDVSPAALANDVKDVNIASVTMTVSDDAAVVAQPVAEFFARVTSVYRNEAPTQTGIDDALENL